MAADKEELGFIERRVVERVEAMLEAHGLSEDRIRKWLANGNRALCDVKAVVYGGTLANGTQTRGWITIEAALEERFDIIEAYLRQLVQQEGSGHAAAAFRDEPPVPGHTSTDQDQASEDQDAEAAA